MQKTLLALLAGLLLSLPALSQNTPAATSGEAMQASIDKRHQMRNSSLLHHYPARNIGPVVQGGRIVDIAVDHQDIHTYYVAYASGGVFKTTNNGVSFAPVFDDLGALTIGDMAIAPSDANTLYVGTGENNSSRSSYAGSGLYKSSDAGKSWDYLGLGSIHHTGRIIIHPDNPQTLWVAAIGPLYSHSPDRGVYKSTDGGKTWDKTLYINDSTGVIDLVIHPGDPNTLWAATWERTRYAWNFKGNGPGTGIYKSTDGGETWRKSMEGLSEGTLRGRIGLDISQSNPNILYAVLDNQAKYTPEKDDDDSPADAYTIAQVIPWAEKDWLSASDDKLDNFLRNSGYPAQYTAASIKAGLRSDSYSTADIIAYLGDTKDLLDETDYIGAELYRSEDGGKTWAKQNEYYLPGVFYSFGYYFGQVRVDPQDPQRLYIHGVPLIVSGDGGKTFAPTDSIPPSLHGDQHAMWINPENPEHILLGNDGGLYVSYDRGARWQHLNNDAVGQFYTVNVDMETPYRVYGGLQDNGTIRGASTTVPGKSGEWEKLPLGCDGMYVATDPRNAQIVYLGCQYGFYQKINLDNQKRQTITPEGKIGEDRERRNWRTPLILSSHNPEILYYGSQRVWRSLDGANNWEAISPDLSRNLPQGNVPHSTITALAESPLKFGLLYAGTDDGRLWRSKDGGGSWTPIETGLPANRWVAYLHPSPHEEGTLFVTLTGYRYDDFGTYIYKSTDYGSTWTSIKGDLPEEATNVLIQDPVHPDLLYLGTDHGTWASLDGGAHWQHLSQIPNVATYDMIVHPRDLDLVVATHGRSVYIADLDGLHAIMKAGAEQSLTALPVNNIRKSSNWGKSRVPWMPVNEPSLRIPYYLSKGDTVNPVTLEITNDKGTIIARQQFSPKKGYGSYQWNLKTTPAALSKKAKALPAYVEKGKYTATLIHGENRSTTSFEIK